MKKRIYLICLATLMTVAAGAFSGCSISAGDVAGIMNNANYQTVFSRQTL